MRRRAWHFVAPGLLAMGVSLHAQSGDRPGHDSIESPVPQERIPEAPVLSAREAIETFTLPPGYVIEPAAEEPLVDKPVALVFDPQGRAWVCEMPEYMSDPEGSQEGKRWGRISILTDVDGDGKFDCRKTFLGGLDMPRALALVEDGLLYADQNQLCYVRRVGDRPVGEREVVDPHYSIGGNVEYKSNGLLRGRDNWIYSAKSSTRYRRVGGRWQSGETALRGQWGISQDEEGRLFYNHNNIVLQGDALMPNLLEGNPAAGFQPGSTVMLGDSRIWPGRVTPGVNRAYIAVANGYDHDELDPVTHKQTRSTAACGPVIYRGLNFPADMQGASFICEPSVNLVKTVKITREGSSLRGENPFGETEFLTSTDERFRPVNLQNGPDGALYLVDMRQGILQHKTYLTSYLRRQAESRHLDQPARGHGRIWRIRHVGGELAAVDDLSRLASAELVELLGHPNGWHCDTAQCLLVDRKDPASPALLRDMLGNEAAPSHGRRGALWSLDGLGVLTAADLAPLLAGKDPSLVRAASYAALSAGRGALRSLERSFLQMPDSTEYLPYKVRALAAIGTPETLDMVAILLRDFRGVPYLRRAAMAGLAGQAAEFVASHPGVGPEFHRWLENSLVGSSQVSDPASYLKGEHLASYQRGENLFRGDLGCSACHGKDGAGLPSLGPPLDGSDWVLGREDRLIKILLHGLAGSIRINGRVHPNPNLLTMPGFAEAPGVSDQNLADIATYVRSAWTNRASAIAPKVCSRIRLETRERRGQPYVEKDFSP